MSRLNIIQKRELEPLILKAARIARHYEIASNCAASVLSPDLKPDGGFYTICDRCDNREKEEKNTENQCFYLHMEAVEKAKKIGGSYIYICLKGIAFWTSPFYSGERFAGALMSGGVRSTENNSDRVKSLAQMMLLCANQISGMSFVQKNVVFMPQANERKETDSKQRKNYAITNGNSSAVSNAAAQDMAESSAGKNQKHNNYLCPLDMERMLLASLRRGDKEEGQKILVELLKYQYREVNGHFPVFRLKALELAVLLSRAASNPKDIKDNSFLDATNRLFKKIEDSSDFDETAEILKSITERMSRIIFSFHGVRHFSALRKAERYIWENYTRKLSLKEIAAASGLSAPYFSTVFKDEMGENLSNYLNRLRVEKAATMLITTDLSISEIAVACGFEDQSWFSKIFRSNTGYTPGKYRECGIGAGGMYAEGNILS